MGRHTYPAERRDSAVIKAARAIEDARADMFFRASWADKHMKAAAHAARAPNPGHDATRHYQQHRQQLSRLEDALDLLDEMLARLNAQPTPVGQPAAEAV
jgi:hypothetical protein